MKQQESMQKIAEPIIAAGQEFLDKNKERDEVTVMALEAYNMKCFRKERVSPRKLQIK